MGIAYGELGEYEKAIDCYKKALEDKNLNKPSYVRNNMGIAYDDLGEYEKAIDCYKKALEDENYDTPGRAWYNMGIAYRELGEYEKAIECYEKAIRYDPEDAGIYNNLGEVLYKLKRPIDAEEQLRKAIQIKTNLAEPHYNLGNILTDEECYEDAEKEYKKALEIEPTNADYLNGLGCVFGKLDQHEKAREYFEKAVYFDPTHSRSHHNLRKLKKIPEMRYWMPRYRIPTWLLYGVPLFIVAIIIAAHYLLLCYDKLSGAEFTAFVTLLLALLIITVLAPVLKSAKAGPFEFNFLHDPEGGIIKPEPMRPLSMEFIKNSQQS